MFPPGELHIPCGISVLSSTGLEQKLEAALQVGSHENSFLPSSHILGFCCSDPLAVVWGSGTAAHLGLVRQFEGLVVSEC